MFHSNCKFLVPWAVATVMISVAVFVPRLAIAFTCDELVVHYDRSNWWWGAFGNCTYPGGPTDRGKIFECAWNQVPERDNDCLRDRLLKTEQTRMAIDNVAAYNSIIVSATKSPNPVKIMLTPYFNRDAKNYIVAYWGIPASLQRCEMGKKATVTSVKNLGDFPVKLNTGEINCAGTILGPKLSSTAFAKTDMKLTQWWACGPLVLSHFYNVG